MTANADFLDTPWRARLYVERVPIGWSIEATAWPSDEDASADDHDHEWWIGLTSGGRTHWHSSSAARSEHGLVDDGPLVDALFVRATGAAEVIVDVWIWLRDEHGAEVERAFRARHVVTEAGTHEVALAVVDDWQRPTTCAVTTLEPHDRVDVAGASGHTTTSVVVPGIGLLVTDREGWVLVDTAGRTPLPGFVPAGARFEAITTSYDGRIAVVWLLHQGWHLALYQLPAPAPRAIIAPTPPANGNTPQPGRFLAGGLALLPVGYDEIGIIDTARGEVRHRLSAGGHVGAVGLDGDATRVWIAGHGHARCHDVATGAVLEDHRIPDSYGRATAFDARARRTYSYDVLAYDPDGVTALHWYGLDGTAGQLLVPDALDYALVPVEGGVVALGRAGLWFADVERRRLARVTGPLSVGIHHAHPMFATREGDELVVWTADSANVRVAVTLPPHPRALQVD